MILNDEQRNEFEKAARPLIEFLNTLSHPHVSVVVDCGRAELSEGVNQFVTEDYIRD